MMYIINADDFGRTETVNRAIVESFVNGYITGTTVMVNMPYYTAAKELAEQYGFKDRVGLHINLISGMPLTEDIKLCPRLTKRSGCFSGGIFRNKQMMFFLTRKEKKAIKYEIRAQIKRYLDDGFTLMHADSHGHIHSFFSLQGIVLKEIKKYGFKSVRISRNCGIKRNIPKRIYKNFMNHKFKIIQCHTDYFGSMHDVLNDWDTLSLKKGFTEIMLHPNYLNGQFGFGEEFDFSEIPEGIKNNKASFADAQRCHFGR